VGSDGPPSPDPPIRRRPAAGVRFASHGLDLEVPDGGVFGFLGPNGAGKTTTIRCVLGLVRPNAGSLMLLGADVSGGLASVIGKVGSIVEQPALFPRFTGRRNLEILGRIHRVARSTIDDVLERVRLSERADDPVRTYSLGMKQRLGIAAALLKDPSVLLLDEPANGLDPAGIVEVRELIRSLGAEGRTVFVSSHILSEVQQTADQVAIIARGRLVKAGPVNEVLAAGRARGLVVRLADLPAGARVLADAQIPAVVAGDTLSVELPPDQAERVTRVLAAKDLYVSELRPQEVDLETVFLELTKDEGLGP